MTLAADRNHEGELEVPEGYVKLTIDGLEVVAPQGELIIRTAERLGIQVPRFCDHPLLDPAGACRQCLVEVEMGGRPMPKPQASCTVPVADGMVVKTQHTSPVADKAQQGVMELLLINHPLDCPICDKGGECPLQNQAMSNGRAESRFVDTKRTFPKPLPISSQVLLDRERCVLCQRCTRFSNEIAGDPFIELLERGAGQQIGTSATAAIADEAESAANTIEGKPFQSYFSGNTIQICPVGALTSAAYRFRSRPFDLVSTPSICEGCSSGCAERVDTRRGKIMRKLASNDPEVNEEWICDKGRFSFPYVAAADRVLRPQVRNAETGKLEDASWTEALRVAAEGLTAARERGVGVLASGRSTLEDAYAYSKFARIALRTNDIDFRARAHSAEELDFLTAKVLGTNPETGVSFASIEQAPAVLCVALEPEDESPIVFLRLRKAARKSGTKVFHLASWTSPAVTKTFGTLLPAVPGEEPKELDHLDSAVRDQLSAPGAVLLVGERAAEVPGLYSAVARLAESTGAKLAWIPRRAGERGALEAGALPTLLPGGRAVADAAARTELETAWGLEAGALPTEQGKDTADILRAAADGELGGLLVGGVDPDDLPDPALARTALRSAGFVVSLEVRHSAVTELADVVLPVAAAPEKDGSFVNWEGRHRPFEIALHRSDGATLPDCRVLDTLAIEMDADLFTQTPKAATEDLLRIGYAGTAVAAAPNAQPSEQPTRSKPNQAVLATWRELLDGGSLQADEPALAGTARTRCVRMSANTATEAGLRKGELAVLSAAVDGGGEVRLPVEIADLPDGVVWAPGGGEFGKIRRDLGVGHGSLVVLRGGGSQA
ncbi:NADH dehydrogenase subunit G [Tamaricihabitans halophyticus]|uniref:NADH-quinone oxidoreductase n=1 Tax=Tamaricihabitans halophyticus TaxID=1262583 RepID=A0A4R2QV46_9PSEU|nr:NADH-quinone oxidoreductase subunit G [Tamaricihabitans halophyticus]TCP53144.1 NADH dehydrogenase subunit G [Tamaricihabitans halophyticus]